MTKRTSTAIEHDSWRPDRRALTALALVLPWFPRAWQQRDVQVGPEGDPRFVAPPGALPRTLEERVASLAKELEGAHTTTSAILADASSNELRPYPAFRALIAKHAPVGSAVMTPKGEPGTPLAATVLVRRRDGSPYSGARVYAYQTSALGWYAAEAPHVSGNAGDSQFARLFTHVRADADGRCELLTIHPTGYPRSDLPSHIHLLIEGEKGDERWTEIRFEDCPRMTDAARSESVRSGFVVVPVEKLAGGGARCTAEFVLPA